MEYAYRDVFDFQWKYPTRAARKMVLRQMSSDEIMHIARSCGTAAGASYYSGFAQQAAFRELIAPSAEDLEKVWQEGKNNNIRNED